MVEKCRNIWFSTILLTLSTFSFHFCSMIFHYLFENMFCKKSRYFWIVQDNSMLHNSKSCLTICAARWKERYRESGTDTAKYAKTNVARRDSFVALDRKKWYNMTECVFMRFFSTGARKPQAGKMHGGLLICPSAGDFTGNAR